MWDSQWFSMKVTEKDFPWVYEKGNKPSLVISTIEAPGNRRRTEVEAWTRRSGGEQEDHGGTVDPGQPGQRGLR